MTRWAAPIAGGTLVQGKPRADHQPRRRDGTVARTGVPEQFAQMAIATIRISQRLALRGVGWQVHMLGPRGHFVPKSRPTPPIGGTLRADRVAYRAKQHEADQAGDVADEDEDEESTVVLSCWGVPGLWVSQPRRRAAGRRRRGLAQGRQRKRC